MRLIVPDSSANFLVGMAKEKWKSLDAQRRDLRLPIKKETLEVLGFLIFLYSSETNNYIRISGGSFSGFLCHPRTFGGKGWNPAGEELATGPYIYPLVDDDHGTRGLKKSDAWKVIKKPPENYGNLDWLGNGKAVSWRGPAGRQFAMDSLNHYPGFTEWDYSSVSGGIEVEHYTPYRNLIYRNGKMAQEFLEGYKVLGCGLRNGKIISVVGVDYAGKVNPDGSQNGFYDEVYWGKERIGFRLSSRPSTPWFFNSDGTEAVNGNTKLTISDEGVCTFSALPVGSGTQTNEYTGADRGTWGVTRSGSWPGHHDFADLTLQGITLNLTFDEGSLYESTGENTYADLPIMISGIKNPVVTITGPEVYAVNNYSYTLTGNHCNIDHVDWEFPEGCGTGTVSVTITFVDGSSVSASMEVRMPSGRWVLVSSENYSWQITWPGWNYHTGMCTHYSGGTKTVETFTNHGNNDECYSHSGPDSSCSCAESIPIGDGWFSCDNNFCPVLIDKKTYEWVCP